MAAGIIVQDDFSGGVNWVDDPTMVGENQLVDVRNMVLSSKNLISQRDGFTVHNSSATGASDAVLALHQIKDVKDTYIPIVQSGAKIYKGTGAFGATGTLAELYTMTAGYKPAIIDSMWDLLMLVDGTDVPLAYQGTYAEPVTVLTTEDVGVNYLDRTTLFRGTTPTGWSIANFDEVDNGGWILIGSLLPTLAGIRIELTAATVGAADTANTAIVDYWNGSAWTACASVSDGTKVGSNSLEQSGDVTFTAATTTPQTIAGYHRYWFRLNWTTGDFSATVVVIARIYTMPTMQALPNIWDGLLTYPVGVKTSTAYATATVPIIDHTRYATDGVLSTSVTMGALTNTAGLYIQGVKKFSGVRITMHRTEVNVANVSFAAKYWDGDSWETLTIVDGTELATATLSQSGSITFAVPAAWQLGKLPSDIDVSYMIVLIPDATLTATVSIAEVELMEAPDTLKIHQTCLFHKNRAWLGRREDALNYLFCSREFQPTQWNGADTAAIGIPSGGALTALVRFFNELMIGTANEIYVLEGYSPETFGLLKINTGDIGPTNHKSCVAVGKYVYFQHSSGFFRFDGLGVVPISAPIDPLFDSTNAKLIPDTRLVYTASRYNRMHNTVEWSVSSGTGQATHNLIAVFDLDYETWFFHNYAAGALVQIFSANGKEILCHGGYTGKAYVDYSGATDDGTAITSYLTTRGFWMKEAPGYLQMFHGLILHLLTEASASIVVTHGLSGVTTLSALGTMSTARTDYNYTWPELYVPLIGTSIQYKFTNSVSAHGWELMRIRIPVSPMRDRVVQ